MRNLQYLQLEVDRDDFEDFLVDNADSIWNKARNTTTDYLGLNWSGPVTAGGGPNASTHSSAMDALVAAAVVSS